MMFQPFLACEMIKHSRSFCRIRIFYCDTCRISVSQAKKRIRLLVYKLKKAEQTDESKNSSRAYRHPSKSVGHEFSSIQCALGKTHAFVRLSTVHLRMICFLKINAKKSTSPIETWFVFKILVGWAGGL